MADLSRYVAHVVIGIAVPALLYWGLRRAARPAERPDSSDTGTLRFPRIWAWLGVLDVVLAAGLWIAMVVFTPEQVETDGPLVASIASGMAILGAVLAVTIWRTEVHVSGHGLVSVSPWTGQRQLAWTQVTSLRYSPTFLWIRLGGSDGTNVYVHLMLSGIPSFREAVRTHLGRELLEPIEPVLRSLR